MTVTTTAQGLQMPNGVAFHNGALYVAEVNRILRYDDIEAHLTDPPPPVVITDSYPRDTHHGWKFIRLGPDGLLYVPVGAPCNICQRPDERYASITRLKLDGTGFEVFAHGIRNTVGFDWHPETKELWFTDNGRDLLGDDLPPDELNHAPKPGLHFGFPYCHGKDIADPEFGAKRPCKDFVGTGAGPGSACGRPGHALLHRFDVSSCVPQPDIYCPARLLESQQKSATASCVCGEGESCAGVHRLRRRLAARREGLGAPCGYAGHALMALCWSRTTTPGRFTVSAIRSKRDGLAC